MLKLIAICVAFFVPVNAGVVLTRKLNTLTTCDCRKQVKDAIVGNEYPLAQVTSAYNHGRGSQATPNKQVRSRRKYPHNFNNHEGFVWPRACVAPFQEFPILPTRDYTGDPMDPGAERIIWDSDGNFCGCITHNSATTQGGFVLCSVPDTTPTSDSTTTQTLDGQSEGPKADEKPSKS